ncbi:hypothetical protein SDC9_67865 [bioreactor metagenome]|uniref:Uncharacterized protein n=1 Tax=bioreactor metagenome TaxID=1076179 RepID=A0A644Y0I7_9ZZZZ
MNKIAYEVSVSKMEKVQNDNLDSEHEVTEQEVM